MKSNLSRIWLGALIGWRGSYIVLAIVYERQTKDKRLQTGQTGNHVWRKIHYKTVNLSWNILIFRKSIWFLLGARSQKNTKL